MPQRRYFSDYGRGGGGRQASSGPNVVPYLLVVILAAAGLFYFQSQTNGGTGTGTGGLPQFSLPAQIAAPPPPSTLGGTLRDANTNMPLAGVVVGIRAATDTASRTIAQTDSLTPTIGVSGAITVAGATTGTVGGGTDPTPAPVLTDTTTAAGTFYFATVPGSPVLVVQHEGYAPVEVTVAGRSSIDIQLVPNTIRGKVTGSDGRDIGGALVINATTQVLSGADGTYLLHDIAPNKDGYDLIVKAAGYKVGRIHLAQTGSQNLTLEPFSAKAIYVSADTIADQAKFAGILQLLDRTELNAVVVDIKKDTDGFVLYDTKLPDVQAIGAVNPLIPNLQALLQTLHDHKIYAIARLPLFWDEKLANARPEWGIKSKSKGGLWADAYDHHWTNPRRPEVWAYNIAIGKEAAQRGFDEIQFDYVRFPSDGDLADADYGPTDNRTRSQVIGAFLAQAQTELGPLGVFLSADVFGLTPIVKDDLGIGQQFEDVSDQVDFISPMAYPSHYADTFLGFPKPADHPSEVVGYTLKQAQARLAGRHARLRPWLQDFTLQGIAYDAPKVRAEIDASENNGALGWMLWNYENTYTEGALKGQ